MEETAEGMQEVMVAMLVESEVKNDKIQMLIQPCYMCNGYMPAYYSI